MSKPICEICRGDLENPASFCKECPQPSACKECLVAYIEDKINSAYMGSCPAIHCPAACHVEKDTKKKRPLLPYFAWKDHVHAEVGTKYTALCSSVLAFLCGGCHTLKSLDLGYEANRSNVCYTQVQKELSEMNGGEAGGAEQFRELEDRLHDYCQNKYSVEEIYRYLVEELFPSLKTRSDEQAWDLFSKVLKMIATPERRVNLHLRYLRDRPRMKTLCCNREHCFRCKVKDYHEGKTCMESTATLDHSIVICPQCSLSLTRGDGCNTVTCVCGKQFSWSQEKENSERCQQFLAQHPEDTSTHCAIVLCTRTPPPAPLLGQAKAWQIRNRIEVNRALTEWFKKKYWPVPSQACTALLVEAQPDGVKEAMELWKNTHAAEVNRRREENDRALRSIFLSLVPDESERAQMAHRLVSQTRRAMLGHLNDEKLVMSATKWIEKHREAYEAGVEEYEVRSANQFLFLFGNRLVKETFPAFTSYPSGGEWCRELSNGELTYTNNNTTVERVGSVSCYPAAFCKLTAERCMFRVVVDVAGKTSNWLTFGVARKGMANSSSDGVGRTSNTWGLSDDRSSSSNQLIIAASGTEVGRWRKFRQGDVLTASIDVVEGWAEVMVNEEEFVHRFTIPAGGMEDYVFAMSFANDHRVSIISDHSSMVTMRNKTASGSGSAAASSSGGRELNLDHTMMYNHLRKQLRNILAVSGSEAEEMAKTSHTNEATLPSSRLMTSGEKWLSNCAGSQEVALEMFEAMRGSVEQVLSLRHGSGTGSEKQRVEPQSHSQSPFETLTWNNLLEAASWYRHNREVILAQRKYDLAITFSMSYGDDAAFMAAMNLMEYHTHKVEKEIAASSLAYMQVFSEEMNGWYDYNSSLREPVIENIAKNCRCLPRHTKTCPMANKK